MRDLPVEWTNYLAGNSGIKVRQLFWVTARNRNTNADETIGIWSGEDHQQFVIDGNTRTYYGSGNFLDFGQLMIESTLKVRKLVVTVSGISPEIDTVLRTYDPKFAPVEVHIVIFNTETNNLVSVPLKVFTGWIDKFPVKRPSINSQGEGRIEMVGATRLLTRELALKRSNESQKKRSAGDTFFADVSMTGQVTTPWGAKGTVAGGGSGSGGSSNNAVRNFFG